MKFWLVIVFNTLLASTTLASNSKTNESEKFLNWLGDTIEQASISPSDTALDLQQSYQKILQLKPPYRHYSYPAWASLVWLLENADSLSPSELCAQLQGRSHALSKGPSFTWPALRWWQSIKASCR